MQKIQVRILVCEYDPRYIRESFRLIVLDALDSTFNKVIFESTDIIFLSRNNNGFSFALSRRICFFIDLLDKSSRAAGSLRDGCFNRVAIFASEAGRGCLALPPAASSAHVHGHHGRAAGVEEVNGVVLAVEIGVQRPGRRGPALQAVPLAKAPLRGLVLPGAKVQHARGGVVVFAIVAIAGDLLRQQFAVLSFQGAVGRSCLSLLYIFTMFHTFFARLISLLGMCRQNLPFGTLSFQWR